jgi:biotin operon repressor
MANAQAELVISAVDKTKAAFAQLKKNLAEIETRAAATNVIFSRFIPALTTAGMLGFAKNLIDTADGMNDLSVRTGVSVDRIAAWDLATRQSGTSVEALASALNKGSKYIVEHSEELQKLGINATSAEELIFQLSDVISSLPADDPRRAAIAMQVLGKSAGELLPLLSQGSAELRKMAEESSKNAQAMAELAPLADNFNDRLEAMTFRANVAAAKGLGPLLTALEKLIQLSDELEKKGEGAQEAVTFAGIGAGLNPLLSIPGVYIAIADSAGAVTKNTKDAADATSSLEKEQQALRIQLALANNELEEQEKALEKSRRAINADAYKQNLDALKGQVQGFKDLGSAMQTAFETAGTAAKEASQQAQTLLASAAAKRLSGQDRILELDLKDASPDDADAIRNRQIIDALDKAKSARLQADFQRIQGNREEAERSLELAEQQAQRADELTGRLNNESLARDRILESAEELARIDEVRASIQVRLAQEETARQEALREQIQENDKRVADYTERLTQLAAKIKELSESEASIKIKLDEEALAKTQQQINELQNRIANLNFQNFTGVYDSQGNAVYREPIPARADGGILPGSSPHPRADNLLFWGTAGEGVVSNRAMKYYGGAGWLNAINKLKLPRYADGGVLSRVSLPKVAESAQSSSGLHRGTIVLPGGERIEIRAQPTEFDKLERAALIHGGLKR